MQTSPESLQQHCAALGQVKADRQMNAYYRQGGAVGGYNAAEVARVAEKECLMKQQQR